MADARPQQKITLVTGKGGVGKSTVAAAYAISRARRGKRVLLVEFIEASYFARVLNKPVSFEPQIWEPGLVVAAWDGIHPLREFLLHYMKFEGVVNLFFDNRVMKTLVDVAPGLKELALLGKVTSGVRGIGPDMPYDEIIVDAFATGHFRVLIDIPVAMADLISMGPMGEQSRAIDRVVKNPENTQVLVVTLSEELPIQEGRELIRDLKDRGLNEIHTVLNRVVNIPDLPWASAPESPFVRAMDQLRHQQTRAMHALAEAAPGFRQLPLVHDVSAMNQIAKMASIMEAW